MGTLYITRHGETEWNKEWRLQGKKDSALTPKGLWQADQLGEHLKDVTIDRIITSTSQRAIHTGERIRKNRPIAIETMASLMEIGLGPWEGQTAQTLKRDYPEVFDAFWNRPDQYVPISPEGETFEAVQNRMRETVQLLMQRHTEETVLIVTHGISLKTLMASFEDKPLADVFKEEMVHPAGLTRVDHQGDRYQIVYKNAIDFQGEWHEECV